MVTHIFGSLALEYRAQALASNLDLVELGLGADIAPSGLGEIIDDNNLMSGHDAMEHTSRKAPLSSAGGLVY